MKEIKCPYDLNQFLLSEPIFENPFPEEECEVRKFYGDCFHCFATAIASRDHQLKYERGKAEQQPTRPTGRWVEMGTNTDGTHNICCGLCGQGKLKSKGHANSQYTKEKYRYCINCGARMIESKEEA